MIVGMEKVVVVMIVTGMKRVKAEVMVPLMFIV